MIVLVITLGCICLACLIWLVIAGGFMLTLWILEKFVK